MTSTLLYPSILSANFENLKQICDLINKSEADAYHLDVMDGIFVPNISFGFTVIETIHKNTLKPLDVHLMIINPDLYIKRFRDVGATTLTVHLESCNNIHKTIESIRDCGMKPCVAIKPKTSVNELTDIITELHSVCIMSVEPGFGGQAFIPDTYSKISQLKALILLKKSTVSIKVDGGVDLNNFQKLIQTGTDILVAGSSIFKSADPFQTISLLKEN